MKRVEPLPHPLVLLLLPHREQKVADRAIGDLAAALNTVVDCIAKMKSVIDS